MSFVIQGAGPKNISMRRDEYGYRWYTVEWFVITNAPGQEFAANAMQCPGLPTPGSTYALGFDVDIWCTCAQTSTAEPVTVDETSAIWKVTQTFTNKDNIRCMLQQRDDPFIEPPQITINGVRYQEEASYDRFGQPIINSAWERLRGKQVEFDRNRLAISIKQNVPTPLLGYQMPAAMIDTVNTAPIWGMPVRTVKLSDMTCNLKYFHACSYYYERTLKFDLDGEGFDRFVLDEGQRVLIGHWSTIGGLRYVPGLPSVPSFTPNRFNPFHFQRFQDIKGNNTTVILNGAGLPADIPIGTGTGTAGEGIFSPCCPGIPIALQMLVTFILSTGTITVPATWDGNNWTWDGTLGTYTPPPGEAAFTIGCFAGFWFIETADGTIDYATGPPLGNTGSSTTCANPLILKFAGVNLAIYGDIGGTAAVNVTVLGGTVTGTPSNPVYPPGQIYVSKYPENNFLLLGVPSIF